MAHSKETIEAMHKFWRDMEQLYYDAEGLRDCAEGEEKEVFNGTRRALSDLRDAARHLYYKWKES